MDEDYLGMVLLRLEGLCTYMKRKAQEGDLNFQRMIDEGHLEHYEKRYEVYSSIIGLSGVDLVIKKS